MHIETGISAKKFSTFHIGGTLEYFIRVTSHEELFEAIQFAGEKHIPFVVVGGGSNTIWHDGENHVCAVQLAFEEITIEDSNEETALWKVGAGVDWDTLVEKTVSENLWGIECMSGIPGSVGAAPVQNIGAYGQELKDVFVSAEVYDIKDKKIKTLSQEDCQFSYRNSIFKSTEKGRYIILSVTVQLSKKPIQKTLYEGLQKYFSEKGIVEPALPEIRQGVLAIRATKLPDPRIIPNCGSFFENPIVPAVFAEKLKEKFPDIKIFPSEVSGSVKIPAGWMIEKAGLKGRNFGNIEVYKNNALVLTSTGDATQEELLKAKDEILLKIKEMFGVELEVEPNIM